MWQLCLQKLNFLESRRSEGFIHSADQDASVRLFSFFDVLTDVVLCGIPAGHHSAYSFKNNDYWTFDRDICPTHNIVTRCSNFKEISVQLNRLLLNTTLYRHSIFVCHLCLVSTYQMLLNHTFNCCIEPHNDAFTHFPHFKQFFGQSSRRGNTDSLLFISEAKSLNS